MLSAIRRQPVRFDNPGRKITGRGGAAPLRPDWFCLSATASRPTLEVWRSNDCSFWRAHRILQLCDQRARLGDDRAAPRCASPLRSAHLRESVGPQIQFASESFINEIAAASGADPVAFRLACPKDPRDIAVVRAAAKRAGWQPPPSP
jgi:hypothetical protein